MTALSMMSMWASFLGYLKVSASGKPRTEPSSPSQHAGSLLVPRGHPCVPLVNDVSSLSFRRRHPAGCTSQGNNMHPWAIQVHPPLHPHLTTPVCTLNSLRVQDTSSTHHCILCPHGLLHGLLSEIKPIRNCGEGAACHGKCWNGSTRCHSCAWSLKPYLQCWQTPCKAARPHWNACSP